MKHIILLCCLLSIPFIGFSQQTHDFGFGRSNFITVSDNGIDTLSMPWAGGLNSVHFNQIDLNFDGIMDLVSFDKHGDKLIPYLNNGSQDANCYTYAPEYASAFPQIYSWMILRDYDCDGRMDLFSYGFGGIRVYRNVGTASTGLAFQLKTNLLNSLQDNVLINILLTDSDYPVIDDVDGDGDLDILVFFGLGAYVQYHRNYSMEVNNNCNFLDYRLEHHCWGYFAESENSSSLFLDINCPWSKSEDASKQLKHSGSTMQLIDLNNDSVMDLLLGDTEYFNIISLINGGTSDSAHINGQDTSFPSYNIPVHISCMPVASWFDFDNDSVNELVFAPFESRIHIPGNYNNIWHYENSGTNSAPVLSLTSTNFLQNQMIDLGGGAHPVLVDYNGDSLLDIIIGNYGYIDSTWYVAGNLQANFVASLALYKNTGTAQSPAYRLIDRDFGNLSQYGFTSIRPAFGDLDGDGDLDLIIGDMEGRLHLFNNTAGPGNPMSLTLVQTNYQNIDVGLFATPQLIDLDRDGRIDLVVGSRNTNWIDTLGNPLARKSSIQYFRNIGSTSSPVFTLITDSLGGVSATDNYLNPYYGYAVPWFFDDTSGVRHLYLGSVNGHIFHYKDIDGNLNGNFTLSDTVFFMVNDSVPQKAWVGIHASPTVADLNSDGRPDLIIGNFSGGLNLFMGIDAPPINVGIAETEQASLSIWIYPNPARSEVTIALPRVNIQGPAEIEIFDISGRIVMKSSGTADLMMHVDVSAFKPGIYFVKVSLKSDGMRRSGISKLVIQ